MRAVSKRPLRVPPVRVQIGLEFCYLCVVVVFRAGGGGCVVARQPAVYILASKPNGTLYLGVTSDLVGRVWQHQNKLAEGFTQKYNVSRLVYYEQHSDMISAIEREKQLKRWKREWKVDLIEEKNPTWEDLYGELW